MATMATSAVKNNQSDRRKSVGGWPMQRQEFPQDEAQRRQSYAGYNTLCSRFSEIKLNQSCKCLRSNI